MKLEEEDQLLRDLIISSSCSNIDHLYDDPTLIAFCSKELRWLNAKEIRDRQNET
jgi:hypothetical protein